MLKSVNIHHKQHIPYNKQSLTNTQTPNNNDQHNQQKNTGQTWESTSQKPTSQKKKLWSINKITQRQKLRFPGKSLFITKINSQQKCHFQSYNSRFYLFFPLIYSFLYMSLSIFPTYNVTWFIILYLLAC